MLYKGKRGGYYLYELTDTDLVLAEKGQDHYRIGNVLLFGSKKDIVLGSELIMADDLETALEYLEGDVSHADISYHSNRESIARLRQQLAISEAKLNKRDELLQDLSSELNSQRYSNTLLIAQLENLREQISIEQLTRNEVIGDLEIASAETFRKDKQLQELEDTKARLEQELAAQICELLELDSANAELQRRLNEQSAEDDATMREIEDSAQPSHNHSDEVFSPDAQVYTLPTGKQIQVYHEFPDVRKTPQKQSLATFQSILRMAGLILLGALLFVLGSMVATARLNDISLGEALDMTLRVFLP